MSRYPSDVPTRVIAVDDLGAAWFDSSSPETLHHVVFARSATSWAASDVAQQAALSDLLAKGSATVWVFGHASMPCWLQVPPQGIRNLRELQAVAVNRARQWLNPTHDHEELMVHADWSAHRPFFCEALPPHWQALLGSNPCVSSPLRLGLTRLTRRSPPSGWYAISTPDEAHLLLRQKGHWRQLRSFRLQGDVTTAVISDQLRGEWQRERLRNPSQENHLSWIHLGHTDVGWSGARDIRWMDTPWQQQINKLPERPGLPGPLLKAGHQLWAFKHLGPEGVAP